MNKKSRTMRLNMECIEKLELLSELTSASVREVAEKIIADFFTRVMNNEENAKQILELKAKLRVRQQIMDMEIPLRLKDGEIVRVEE